MIRAVMGDGVFGLCPEIAEDSVTFARLLIQSESVLGKPCELQCVDSLEIVAVVLMPESADQVSSNISLPRIL